MSTNRQDARQECTQPIEQVWENWWENEKGEGKLSDGEFVASSPFRPSQKLRVEVLLHTMGPWRNPSRCLMRALMVVSVHPLFRPLPDFKQ